MINGVNLNDMAQNQITFQPSINTVSEFKVDNSTFSAEYGRNSGAIVNIATRSGANDVHGEVFEFFRDNALDSRNYLQRGAGVRSRRSNATSSAATSAGRSSGTGLSSSAATKGLRQRQGIDINSGVLRDDQRAAVTDPVSQKLLPLIPTAERDRRERRGRFVGSATAPVDIDQWTGDVRHNVSNADALHGYYAFQRDRAGRADAAAQHDSRVRRHAAFAPPDLHAQRNPHLRLAISSTKRASGSTASTSPSSPNAKLNPVDYGIKDGVTTAIGMPQITVVGLGLNFGGPSSFPQGRTDTTFVFSDSASYLRGNHSFKFGGEFRRFINDNFTSDTGTFQFGSLAAFQTGLGNNFTITLGDRPSNVRQQAVGLFVQDTSRPRPTCRSISGCATTASWAPPKPRAASSCSMRRSASLVQTANPYETGHNLQPRVGVIWTPSNDGRTVVRGAYAVMVDMPVTNVVSPTSSNPPLATPLTFAGNIRLDSAAATALAVRARADFGRPELPERPDADVERERRAADRAGRWA